MALPVQSASRQAELANNRVWDYGLHNMCLIQAVRSSAMDDVMSALEGDAILEWLTPGFYKIFGEYSDSDSENEEDPEEIARLSEGFPGYEFDYQASNGNTALHIAARMGRQDIAAVLLRNKWSLCVRNGRNETPIEVAELYYEDNMADWLRAYVRRKRIARVIFKIAVQLRLGLKRVRARRAAMAEKRNAVAVRSGASAEKSGKGHAVSSKKTTRSRKMLRSKKGKTPVDDLKLKAVTQPTRESHLPAASPFPVYEDSVSASPLDTTRVGGGTRRSWRLKRKFELS